jgi:hypothetical protein
MSDMSEDTAKLRELAEEIDAKLGFGHGFDARIRLLLEQAVSALRSSAVRVEAAERRCQALEKDAERYRWLRAPHRVGAVHTVLTGLWDCHGPETLDAAIDAAIDATMNPEAP